MPFNPKLLVQLACYASPMGIAGVLSHGEERPIAFASRSSQLEHEALEIVYAVPHFHEYIYGSHYLEFSTKTLSYHR